MILLPHGADSTTPFVQHRDILALKRSRSRREYLWYFPIVLKQKHREILFLKETSDLIAVWEGAKLDKEQAFETSGIKTVYWLDQFDQSLMSLMSEAENVYINTNEHTRANTEATN